MSQPLKKLELLTINNNSRNFLKEISKWTFFLSILGFIGITLLIVIGVFSSIVYGEIINTFYGSQIPFNLSLVSTVIYLLFALLYFFPVYYLYSFSRKTKIALQTKNDEDLSDAFGMLKSHFKFIGVFTIIILSLYALIFIFSLIGLAFV